MVIRNLVLSNFCGFEGEKCVEVKNFNSLLGKNGVGKTTVLNAIRYALTGWEPEGDIINAKAESCSVKIVVAGLDGVTHEFGREKFRNKPSKFYVDGVSTTQKSLNETIQEIVGVPLDNIKTVSSTELIAAMKPQEFATFVMGYIAKEMDRTEILEKVPECSLEMVDVIEKNLPETGITLEMLSDFDEYIREQRKAVKKQIAELQALLATKPEERPDVNEEDLKLRLEKLQTIASERRHYLEMKAAHDKAVESMARHTKMIEELKAKADVIKADAPDMKAMKEKEKELTDVQDSIANQKSAIASVYNALSQLEVSLANLGKPVCPLSPLITCTQDKSAAKADLENSIASTKDGIERLNDELCKAESKERALRVEIDRARDNASLYERKALLLSQVEEAKKVTFSIPSMPEEVKEVDMEREKREVEAQLKLWSEFKERGSIIEKLNVANILLETYEKLAKAFAEKGIVRTSIVDKYLSTLEGVCNSRSARFRPEITFKFVNENGIKVLMNNGSDELPYESLSGGERAYMLFIIMDMLNQLTGTRLLMLDELNVMDADVLRALLTIILDCKDEYDHIFLASVGHTNIASLFEEFRLMEEEQDDLKFV